MSRSYKKHPCGGDNKSNKKFANKKVRQKLKDIEFIIQNSEFKKVFEQYDICDFWDRCTWEDYWQSCLKNYYNWGWKFNKEFPNKEKEYKRWKKWYKQK